MTFNIEKFRPEVSAGGFSRYEGVIQFFTRVQSLIDRNFVVLDFGAGRGLFLEDNLPFRRNMRTLKGKVSRVIGVDVDVAVLSNKGLDEAKVITPNVALPFADATFDLILSEWVLEHLEQPEFFAHEMHRLTKPGGWVCARTPNKWGLTALGARLIPNSMHVNALGRLQPGRQDKDVFPTRYKLNTMNDLKRHFPDDQWKHFSYFWRGEPKYFGRSAILFLLMQAWNWLVPSYMATDIFVFLQKR